MILIADSGSTKTDWRLVEHNNSVKAFRTCGFNPYYQDSKEILDSFQKELLPLLSGKRPDSIYFYGAGCSTGEKQSIIRTSLLSIFPETKVEVQSDLIGAARALCGKNPGIACILGTGSGSCSWNGVQIIEQIPSLGFILGDEGSGAYLGKKLITAYLREKLPTGIRVDLNKQYHINKDEVLRRVNKEEIPSRYLASFARFYPGHLDDPFIFKLAYQSFEDFARNYIVRYRKFRDYPVHFVGSIAYHNRSVLEKLAADMPFRLEKIITDPVEGLIHFHTQL